jgi:hypothetical protein
MDLCGALAGSGAFGRSVRRYAGAIWVSVYLSARRIAGRYYQGRRASAFPLDNRRYRRNIKLVQRTRITQKALQDVFDKIPKEYNGVQQSFVLASAVVRGFLGEKWFDLHIMPNRRKPGFLTMDGTDATTLDKSAYRLMDLAELLYNLQHVVGFDEYITRMRDGDIDGTYAELDFGRMLYLNQIKFRYIVPSGVKGSDYDVDVIYPNGLTVCGDAKCKIEATEFGVKTIDDTLRGARRQLPDNQPGIVFVKIPPRWLETPNFAHVCHAVAWDFLRTTQRIVSVKYYAAPLSFMNGILAIHHAFMEISNPITDFGNDQNWDIFRRHILPPEWNGMPPWWQRIMFYPDGKPR